MVKAVSLLIVGLFLGAGTTFFFIRADDADADRRGSTGMLPGNLRAFDRRDAAEVLSVADSLAVYRAAAAETDLVALQTALETTASEAWSPARNIQIDALIARMSELAPARAAIATRTLGLDMHFVVDAFVYLAEIDPDAALTELANVDNARIRTEMSLALLEHFGNDDAGFSRVTERMPQAERESLRVEWLGRRAGIDPVGAFRAAERLLDADLQRRALLEVGAAWVEHDPLSALSQADLLADPLRSSYRSNLYLEWARLDGAGLLGWLQSASTVPDEAVAGIRYLTMASPELTIGVLDSLPGQIGTEIRIATLQGLAEVDPEAAMARAAALAPGSDREKMLLATAMSIARSDPDAALGWVQNLSPPSPSAVQQVAIAIAQSNPDRAFDFLDNPPDGIDSNLIASLIVSVVSRDPAEAEILANQLVARNSIQDRNTLRNLIGNWMQQDPARTLEWILAHDEQINAGVFSNAAQAMARSDAPAAAAYADRIPAEYRSAWIAQVAAPYARNDPAAALNWVTRFQGQDYYDAALRGVIAGSAAVDPRRAAELLAEASADVQSASTRQVAQIWANRDPGAAERWALDLDRGAARDQALNALISRHAASGNIGAAEALLGQVTNAATRRELEEQIATINARR